MRTLLSFKSSVEKYVYSISEMEPFKKSFFEWRDNIPILDNTSYDERHKYDSSSISQNFYKTTKFY